MVLREEPDLRSALRLLLRYEQSYNEALRMRLEETDEVATIRLWFEFGEPAPADQALALGAAALHGIVRECVGPHWRPLAICFPHRAPADLETYHRVFGAGLQFEHDFTGLVIYARDLSATNPLSDPLMRPYAQQFLESVVSPRAATSRDRVKELVEFLLPLGKCTMDHIASTLGVDRRTLHRHLAEEGESFSSLLYSTRADPGRALPRQRPVLDDRHRSAARVHRTERLLTVVPPAVRHQSQRLAGHEPELTAALGSRPRRSPSGWSRPWTRSDGYRVSGLTGDMTRLGSLGQSTPGTSMYNSISLPSGSAM